MKPRWERVRQSMAACAVDALLITQAENRRYLSGFTGSAGALLISHSQAILATDFRYREQAQKQATGFAVVPISGEMASWLPQLLDQNGIKRLGCESQDLSYALYDSLTRALGGERELVPTRGLVERVRAVKKEMELDKLRRAYELVEDAMEYIQSRLQPGMREVEAAWEVEKFLRENGSEPLPFELIVASGPNAAMPHAHPTPRAIGVGEPVIFDIGARLEGYISDYTRTLCLGSPPAQMEKVYSIMWEAQHHALQGIKVGMTGHQADALARGIIEAAGYRDNFGHGLGHGVGLATHEEPRLGPGATSPLEAGMVFTLEPGIYIEGWGGVRIEDGAWLGEDGAQLITRAAPPSPIRV